MDLRNPISAQNSGSSQRGANMHVSLKDLANLCDGGRPRMHGPKNLKKQETLKKEILTTREKKTMGTGKMRINKEREGSLSAAPPR